MLSFFDIEWILHPQTGLFNDLIGGPLLLLKLQLVDFSLSNQNYQVSYGECPCYVCGQSQFFVKDFLSLVTYVALNDLVYRV